MLGHDRYAKALSIMLAYSLVKSILLTDISDCQS